MAIKTFSSILSPFSRSDLEVGIYREAQQEFEQSLVRLAFILIFTSYIFFLRLLNPDLAEKATLPLLASACYSIFCLVITFSFYYWKSPSVTRKLTTLVGDNGIVLFGLFSLAEYGAPLYAIMLLITIGYGARFGIQYLYLATLLSNLFFLIVIENATFWMEHRLFSYSLLITNIIIPVFVSMLLRKLVIANSKAKLANEAKTRFLANMSHEIRTPLSGIIGICELMTAKKLDDATLNNIGTIEYSSKHLLCILNDILDLAKIEAGRLAISKAPFDLHSLINFASKSYESSAKLKGVRFIKNISAEIPYDLIGDKQRLLQVIMNLLSNAVKFTEEGYIELRVDLLSRNTASVNLRFEVIDTGIGIPEHKLNSIFDRFLQVDDSNTRKIGGTGLGTAISNDIVRLLGGEIRVESTLGKGSKFYFDLEMPVVKEFDYLRFDDRTSITLSVRSSFENTISPKLSSWGINNIQLHNTEDVLAYIMNLPGDIKSPILIIDDTSFHADVGDLCDRLHRCSLNDLRTILITENNHLQVDYSRIRIDAVVTDINTERQIYNALHSVMVSDQKKTSVNFISDWNQKNRMKHQTILIAEDVEINRRLLQELLGRSGYSVIAVEDGLSALDRLEEDVFDLAIVDMQMPGMTGIDVVKLTKLGDGLNQNTPFIVLTANVTEEAEQLCNSAGVDAYLTKPVDMPLLLKIMDQLIEGSNEKSETKEEIFNEIQIANNEGNEALNIYTLNQLKLISNRKDFLYQIINGFQIDTDNLINTMHFSLRGKKYSNLIDQAHAVKGSAVNIGATKLIEIAGKINESSSQELEQNGEELLRNLRSVFSQTIRELKKYAVMEEDVQ